jgi:hypothetical protein
MGEECRTRKDEKFLYQFSLRYLKGRDLLGDLEVVGEIEMDLK